MHVKEAQRTLGSGIGWICDSMSNDLKHALGDRPNSEFIIDPEGRIVRSRSWSSPSELRRDLTELVGAVEKPTRVSDLKLKTQPLPRVAAQGVVPRPQLPGRMRAVLIEPKESSQPYYMKLRAEAEDQVLQGETGKLYLGFHVDPIYHVHWNNLVAPIKYEISTPDGVSVSPPQGQGPQVKEAADIDPREFLLDVTASGDGDQPLKLTVKYFACNDEAGWCKMVTQEYAVYLKPDRDAGSAMRGRRRGFLGGRGGSFSGGPGGRPPGFAGFPGPGGRPPAADAEIRQSDVSRIQSDGLFGRFDKNRDGSLAKEEVPAFLWKRFSTGDADGDAKLTKQEFEQFRQAPTKP